MACVLVIGATGNIGSAAITAALRSNHKVLAIVRNEASAAKLFANIGSKQGITTVEADITSPSGVQSVVDKVRAGQLPAFQHVFSAAGGVATPGPLSALGNADLKASMDRNFETNFYAYRATVPYLLSQTPSSSNTNTSTNDASWTLQTGMEGEFAATAGLALSQGALFAMATAACRELENTNVRFNEIRLGARVEADKAAEEHGSVRASEYAGVYEKVLGSPEMRGGLVRVVGPEGVRDWRFERNQGALLQF